MATIKDDALCIRHWDWSETSQTVSLFTREHGILRGLAKGAKREKAPYSGGIELATRGEVVALTKPQSTTLATVTSWDLQESFPAARTSLLGFKIAMGMLDAIGRSLHESDPHPALFDGALTSLRNLESDTAHQRTALIAFLLLLLKETGHAPELSIDVRSGEALKPATIVGFSPTHGGVTATSGSDQIWRARHETIDLLRAISRNAYTPAMNQESSLKRAGALLIAYLSHVVESDIPGLTSLRTDESP